MIPIVLGVAAIAAMVLSSCGGDSDGLNGTNDNTDAGATGGKGGTGGTATSGSSGTGAAGTGASGGTAGTGGTSTSGGLGGTGGTGALDGGIGGEAGSPGSGGIDGGGGDGGGPEILPYHFGILYGSKGIQGTGTLTFANSTSCQLLSGSFNAQVQGGSPFNFSVNLGGNQSLDFCDSEAQLPLSGGLFDGVTWYLTNHSQNPPFNQSWEITSCLGGDAGTANCSGALEASSQ